MKTETENEIRNAIEDVRADWRKCVRQCGRYVCGVDYICGDCRRSDTGLLSWCYEGGRNMFDVMNSVRYIRHLEDVIYFIVKGVELNEESRSTIGRIRILRE